MSTELENITHPDIADSKDTLMLLGGAALVLLGAGLILSTPAVRAMLGDINVGDMLSSALPKDFQRYLRLKSM